MSFRKQKKRSLIWSHFEDVEKGRKQCKYCFTIIKYWGNMKAKHSEEYNAYLIEHGIEPVKKEATENKKNSEYLMTTVHTLPLAYLKENFLPLFCLQLLLKSGTRCGRRRHTMTMIPKEQRYLIPEGQRK